MASLSKMLTTVLLLIVSLATDNNGTAAAATAVVAAGVETAATWCVARSDASEAALQKAMDDACGAGADCAPVQPSGLCYLPNTLQSHASYAFNSYYQRRRNASDSCDFGGTATASRTDPSYGSCIYPSSSSTAGGTGGTTTTNPYPKAPPPPGPAVGGLTPRLGPVRSNASTSKAAFMDEFSLAIVFISVSYLFFHSCIYPRSM